MSHREVPREMSNRIIFLAGGGQSPDLLGRAVWRGASALCLMIGLLASASSVLAAEIVEVRVGRHVEFTRVVFELDRAAGYRIERADPTSNVAELIVSLEASSIPRRIHSSKSLIEQVEVEPSGSRAVARISLTKGGLRLKEMILTNPPRIVLDVFSDPQVAANMAAKVSKPIAEPKPEAVPSFDEPTFEDIVGALPGSDEPAPAPQVVPTPAPPTAAPAKAPAELAVVDEPTISTPLEEPVAVEEAASMPAQELVDSQPTIPPVPSTTPAAADPTPVPRGPRPMVVRTDTAKDQGSGLMTWALVGSGVILLLGGGLLVARRMGGGEEVNFVDDDADAYGSEEVTVDHDLTEGGENPFEGLSSDDRQMTLGGSDDQGGATTATPGEDEEKISESVVFGDSGENNMEDMEVISREQVNESLGGMPAASGSIPEEFQQMMREMNLRVESLEGRIDELVDARDRLERQVAAQTEELRVQRAAIARTQRAVRNLARPEDEQDDQEPTEPAFRDPNQPSAE